MVEMSEPLVLPDEDRKKTVEVSFFLRERRQESMIFEGIEFLDEFR
jgi:hypothetical protein